MPTDQPWNVYREQLSSLYLGIALWEPEPVKDFYNKVSIGDVGYVHNGIFYRMFNVTLPWENPLNQKISKVQPGNYTTMDSDLFAIHTIRFKRGDYYSPGIVRKQNAQYTLAQVPHDALGFTYECKGPGALLFLPHDGQREYTIREKAFEKYIRDNVGSWFDWSKNENLPVERMEDLILVTECTLVTLWAAAAFIGRSESAQFALVPQPQDSSGQSFEFRNFEGDVAHNCSYFDSVNQSDTPNQCVFIKGFRAKRTIFWTKPIRAEAEPLPDDPDDDHEDEIQVTRVQDAPKYRDPAIGILDYIVEKCHEGVIAIAHDDDLQIFENMQTLTADAVEHFLHENQIPVLFEDGVASIHAQDGDVTPVQNDQASATAELRGEQPPSFSSSKPNTTFKERLLSKLLSWKMRRRDDSEYEPSLISVETTRTAPPAYKTSSLFNANAPVLPQYSRPNVEPVPSQDDLRLAPSTNQIQAPADTCDDRQCLESTLKSILHDDSRFNILVLGEGDSGKSSLINKVFKVDMSVTPGDVSGDIVANAEFRQRDKHRLTVRECSRLRPLRLQSIKDFIETHSHPDLPLSQRLHAIWICVSMTGSDFIDGAFGEGKEILGLGVPVVVVFTKFDLVVSKVLSGIAGVDSRSHESARATAHRMSEEHCRTFLRGNPADVPFEMVSTDSKYGDLIDNLVVKTNRVLTTHSRNALASPKSQKQSPMSPVLLAWSLSQRVSRDIIIQATIEVGRSMSEISPSTMKVNPMGSVATEGYWRDLWVTDNFAGYTLENCLEVIHNDIIGVFDLPDKDRYLWSKTFRDEISNLLQDLSINRSRPTGAGIATFLGPWSNEPYQNSKENICCVMGYIVDLTVVLSSVFESTGGVSPGSLQLAIKDFVDSGHKATIHAEIRNYVGVTSAFTSHHGHDLIMERIIDLITQFI